MFHVEHFMKTKIQHFVKEIKLRANPIIDKINWLALWNFNVLFIGYLVLKDFSKCLSSKKQRFHLLQICKNWIKCFFVQKKRKTNSFIKYSNILNNGLPYTEYLCRSNKQNRAGISENFSYQIIAVWVWCFLEIKIFPRICLMPTHCLILKNVNEFCGYFPIMLKKL